MKSVRKKAKIMEILFFVFLSLGITSLVLFLSSIFKHAWDNGFLKGEEETKVTMVIQCWWTSKEVMHSFLCATIVFLVLSAVFGCIWYRLKKRERESREKDNADLSNDDIA